MTDVLEIRRATNGFIVSSYGMEGVGRPAFEYLSHTLPDALEYARRAFTGEPQPTVELIEGVHPRGGEVGPTIADKDPTPSPSTSSSTVTRRRRAVSADASPEAPATTSAPSASSTTPISRRRRAGAAVSTDAPAAPTSEEAAPAAQPGPTRRRRASAAVEDGASAAASQPEPTVAAETATSASRRRRGAGATTPAQPSPTTGASPNTAATEYTDQDLSKAASDAARRITPASVMRVLKNTFGVDRVDELKGEQRAQFVGKLEAAV